MKRAFANSAILILFSLICGCASASSRHDEANNTKRINACYNSGGTWVYEYNYCQPSKTAEKEKEKWLNLELEKIKKQKH